MSKILVVEDHENIRNSICDYLTKEGFEVEPVGALRQAKEKMGSRPDLVILDWNLPDGQGLDFLAELRKQGIRTPVLFLTARVDVVDRVLGLEIGANDYITKPFELRELLARIRVQLRQTSSDAKNMSGQIHVGTLKIDRVKHTVEFHGRSVELVNKEFELLALLAESPGKVFSREEILNKVWGYDLFPTTRTVDTHVMLLRQKLDENLIQTVRAVGYKFAII